MNPSTERPESFFERLNSRLKSSITVRLVFIAILSLILLIPASMVEDLIRERNWRRNEVVQNINSSWGNPQTITGPVLTVPYEYQVKDKDEKVTTLRSQAHFLPDRLDISGDLTTEKRHISLFESVVYNTKLNLEGSFKQPDLEDMGLENKTILWDESFVSLGISDMRGIKERLILNWGEYPLSMQPGSDNKNIIASGVSVKVPNDLGQDSSGVYFSLLLDLNGSESLTFLPLGAETNVKLNGDWPHPGFAGSFLPEHDISETGFKAEWKVLSLNRNYPQQWIDGAYSVIDSGFNINLVTPVDDYQKSMRSVKYALMLISFTFLIFFFVEIRSGKRVHPIQFILVGLSLIVFYTLLISLAEHITFNWSFLVSSVAVTSLIAGYFQAIFKQGNMTSILSFVLALMYLFIFTTLQLQDYALLIGSIGLFLVLAVVMYLSRKVDWYALSSNEAT